MIYIVEDDASIRELEQYALQTNQYTVRGFEDGASFWAAVRETVPDLVILDVMLPDEDGYQILGRLRETAATRTVPVIMVTAKTSEIDVVKGLDHGADDYLCKPFGIMEFISRVKAVLRRASTAPASTTTLRFGDITLDDVARTVTVDGEPVELTFKEYSLLHFFLEHPEEVLARGAVMWAVSAVSGIFPGLRALGGQFVPHLAHGADGSPVAHHFDGCGYFVPPAQRGGGSAAVPARFCRAV